MRRTKAMADIRGIEEVLEIFKKDCGRYPTTEDGLKSLVGPHPRTKACNPDFAFYLERLPIDPWGHEYVFTSDGLAYRVKSYAADGREGGIGRDADIDSAEIAREAPGSG